MNAIFISIVIVLLYQEIGVIVSKRCCLPNEEFRKDSCEIYCREFDSAICMGQVSSKCFCKAGTVRYTKNITSERGDCITIEECTEKICDENETFKEYSTGVEICSCDGNITFHRYREPLTSCACDEGFIRYVDTKEKCITRGECEKKRTNSTCQRLQLQMK